MDLNANENSLSLQFDKTTNEKNYKELQVRVIHWSESEDLVLNRHLETKFIDRGTAAKLFEHLMNSIDLNGIALKRILTLVRDGPNVNKSGVRSFAEKCKKLNLKKIFEFGSCYLHIVNNRFLSGLNELSLDIADLLVNIKEFSDRSDLRLRRFEKIQKDLNLPNPCFIKHCSTRWLTLKDGANQMIEQLRALRFYYFQFVPKEDKATLTNKTYLAIVNFLKNPYLEGTLHFISYMSGLFAQTFTAFMQRSDPLVHLMYSRLETDYSDAFKYYKTGGENRNRKFCIKIVNLF